ncbi:DUF4176 domain-containing protein [Ruminococcus sp.]|jgi:hypothetical protein|uniref:DUF4176 domain-containing protein n=1 Tax=Ruminococcus sp. TaxID=41978 RepID=UPI00260E3790|nr:DUF4176 domain-containing protein [Ruminococcus sp.]MEE0022337.1 DUF4176 domain-containing protein [Ruminococcus sp.]
MLQGILPIGTVVLLKNATKRLMIIGVCQKNREGVIWDYSAVIYPEGYMSADKTIMFNNEDIDKIYAMGYQDAEQFNFKAEIDAAMEKYRSESAAQ